MRIVGLGHGMLVVAAAGLAVASLGYREFEPIGRSLPAAVPARDVWVAGLALLVLAASIGLCFTRTALAGAWTIGAYLAAWLLTRLPAFTTEPLGAGSWYGLCEALTPIAGLLILYPKLRCRSGGSPSGRVSAARLAQVLFGLDCLVYGWSHFAYAEFTARLVPVWLPDRIGLAHVTGLCHVLAGLGIITGVLPRLAATLEAIMMSAFGLLVWVPTFWAHPPPAWATPPRYRWSELLVTALLAASAWIVAASFRRQGDARHPSGPPAPV